MKIANSGKYAPLLRDFLKRRTMFDEKKIQIRVAIDLNFAADKVQSLGFKANDTTSSRHEEIRYSDDRFRPSSLSNSAQ